MATNGQGGWLISEGFHRGLLAVIVTATLMSAGVGGAVQTVVLEDFESGGTAGATQATPTNSSSTDFSNSAVANVTDAGSKRLQITDADGIYNGITITLPATFQAPGYYLITADVKVDNPAGISTYGMGAVVGGTTTTKISDVNAGYVMNLNGTTDAAKGYQTIGAAVNIPAGGSFPQDLTVYFGSDISGNSFNASAFDGNYNGGHRKGTATWPAGSANAVYVDNIKVIGPGNFGEERHMWISIGDGLSNLNTLESHIVGAKNNNFNCIDILARYRANAIYVPNRRDSTYFNPEPFLSGVNANNDPLQYAIDRGHELGLKVYISFSSFVVSESSTYPAFLPSGSIMHYYNAGAPRAMINTDPSAEGLWADLSRNDVRQYTKSVLLDIVKNYDIDGVIFDRIRYPSSNYSYNPQGLAELGIAGIPSTSDATFRNARREAVTTYLAECYTAVTDLKPWVVIGTSPIAFSDTLVDTYNGVQQFWPKWNSRLSVNRNVFFGVCDLYQPQFYRLAPTAPVANTTLMKKAQFGDVATFAEDFGLMPGALSVVAPTLFHPSSGDAAQSSANAQNITDARGLSMSGFGIFAATRTLADIGMIRNPAASTAGVDVLANPVPTTDYLFKAGYDNLAPNNVTDLLATPQADGTVRLTWTLPAPASDGDSAASYVIYRSKTTPVKQFYANVIASSVPGTATSFVVPVDFEGTYYYTVVAVDDYNNHAEGVPTGPTLATGEPVPPADLIVDNPAAVFTGTWTTASSATDKFGTDYRFKSPGTGLANARFNVTIPVSGTYNISEWHSAGTNRATNAPYTFVSDDTATSVTVDQRSNGGKWNIIGNKTFTASSLYNVTITDVFTGSVMMADAIKWSYVIQPPTAPTDLVTSVSSQTQVGLAWTDTAANERNTIVARSLTPGGPYATIATLGINTTSYLDTGLSPNTTYYYVVRTINSVGTSGNSVEASATTFPLPPEAPSGLVAAELGSSQIDLAWADNSDNEDNFVVARAESVDGPYLDLFTLPANAASYSDTSVSPATTYHYKVRAVNTGGASSDSNTASATTLPLPPVAPGSLVAATVSASQINLTWADNADNEALFVIASSTLPDGPFSNIATVSANITSYANTGLSPATTYYYVVRAQNAGGTSSNSNTASATTLPLPPVAPSSLVAAMVSASQINLTWADNSDNEAQFVIARSTLPDGPFSDVATVSANTTSYANTGLSPATTYYYVVRAQNAGGTSANSNTASATTLPLPPSAPAGLAASAVSSSQINLIWTDTSANEVNFVIGRSATSGGPYTDIVTLAANTTSYSNTSLAGSTTYYYVVRATNTGGASANSNQASATTQPNTPVPPTGLAATVISTSQINLAWTDNASNEANFVVARGAAAAGPFTDIATLGANVTSYNNTGLAAGTVYYYVVRATNAGGSSANSNVASAQTAGDVIVDNNSVNFTASANWSTATSAADKFGADYRFRATAAVSDVARWNYSVNATAPYEIYAWWSQGSNRSSSAPYQVFHQGGQAAVNKNQQSGGGAWQSLGIYWLNAGANKAELSCWTTTGFVVMADAVKIVDRTSSLPGAPSGLVATAVSASQINLAWTDNATNETNFVVSRATSAAGPFVDLATLGANVTSYSNTALASNTTYYYRVRAKNAIGDSANSNTATNVTWPADIIIDNSDAGFSASVNWSTATSAADKFGSNYRTRPTTAISDLAVWNFTAPQTRAYQIYAWWSQGSNRSATAPYSVIHAGGTASVNKNQQSGGGAWQSLGTWTFNAGTNSARLSCWTTTGFIVVADAIKVVAR